jgi:hypothetical protein
MKEKLETTELLILSDGKILVHNLTPAMAELLAELDPDNLEMRQRAEPKNAAMSCRISLNS